MNTISGGTAIELEATATDANVTGPPPHKSLSSNLPEKPVVTIQPSKRWRALDLRDVWVYRELLYLLALRDIQIKYKQTVLGVIWFVLQPLLMTLIFTLFLGRIVKVPSDGVPYSLFAYAGLMVWSFFSGALSSTGNSLVGNAHLITKVYFPRLIIPLASVIARLVDFGVAFAILLAFMFFYHIHFSWSLLLVPIFVVLLVLLSLGVGLWTAALNVKYRDINLALPVVIQLWMFVSPVVYPLSYVPPKWKLAYSLNPLVGILEGFRAALFGSPFEGTAIAISGIMTSVLLVYAVYAYRNRERTFADIV
jgi:lipopolysaccharide transport system permease protein